MTESNAAKIEIRKADTTKLPGVPEDEDRWFFNALAKNGEIVATSELYNSEANAVRAAQDTFPEARLVKPRRASESKRTRKPS